MSLTEPHVDLDRILHERFGLEQFRSGQREVIENVLEGRDVLCVMPTGGGKSLCYQLPAMVLPGITLVVSPLIALMKDQVDGLNQRGLEATLINSTLDPAEQRARMDELESGRHRLVYVAPERFRSGRFMELMARLKPSLMAIDEAHCISEWGHDFRPDYARLGLVRRQLGDPPCIALTATATDAVRRDIADHLSLRDPELFITGFDRPNLHYSVVEAGKDEVKQQALARTIHDNPGPAIVYAPSRARCEAVADFLRHELRREVVVYHAGLTREQRTAAQESFMTGEAEIVVATNAFGMGVDKRNIRSVVHYNIPGTIEAYYQEAGRAGRDGQSSQCLLLYSYADRFLHEMFIENEYPPRAAILQIYEFLRRLDDDPIQLTHAEIHAAAKLDMNESAIGSAMKILDTIGAIEKFLPRENQAIVRINFEQGEEGKYVSLSDRLSPQAQVQRTVLLALEGLVRGRIGEPVYFRPDQFIEAIGIDRPAFTRALKSLTAELPIDYVPPFRGNAIRVVDRSRKFRDLKFDYSNLERRKQREFVKLEKMIEYSRSRQCRRSFILGYFGESGAADVHCGGCDNCQPDDQARPGGVSLERGLIDTPEGRDLILKILSGIARAKGRFGKITIAQMLSGSESERMTRWRLDSLSTFGILRDAGFTQKELCEIIDALSRSNHVETQEVDRFKPVITLTEEGWRLLKSQEPWEISLGLPPGLLKRLRRGGSTRNDRPNEARGGQDRQDGASENPSSDESSSSPGALRDRLRAFRNDMARELGQPAYCIFTNETLDAIVQEQPATPAALAGIKGLGRSKIDRHGAAILRIIEEAREEQPHESREPVAKAAPARPTPPEPEPVKPSQASPPAVPTAAASSPSPAPPARAAASSHVPTEEWTYRLIERGFTAQEAAAIRGLEFPAIVRHLGWMKRRGRSIPVEAFLTANQRERWNAWTTANGAHSAPPDSEEVPELWRLFLECRADRT